MYNIDIWQNSQASISSVWGFATNDPVGQLTTEIDKIQALKAPVQKNQARKSYNPLYITKHTQIILPTNCLSVFDHFVGLTLKVVNTYITDNLAQKSSRVDKPLHRKTKIKIRHEMNPFFHG